MASNVAICPACDTKNRVPVAASGKPMCASCGTVLPWVVNATDADFDTAVDTSRLVLVDLWAPWCGPCKIVAPILEQLARDYLGRLKVVKVDVDGSPLTAQRFSAQSIPTLVFMKDGDMVDRVVGAQPDHVLRKHIDALI